MRLINLSNIFICIADIAYRRGSYPNESTRGKKKQIYGGKQPLNCTFCGKAFNFKSLLDKHVRIHTGERPFKCPLCLKAFNQKAHLDAHRVVHSNINI